MASLLFFGFAALFEITGCYSFWVWFRKDWVPLWRIPGGSVSFRAKIRACPKRSVKDINIATTGCSCEQIWRES